MGDTGIPRDAAPRAPTAALRDGPGGLAPFAFRLAGYFLVAATGKGAPRGADEGAENLVAGAPKNLRRNRDFDGGRFASMQADIRPYSKSRFDDDF